MPNDIHVLEICGNDLEFLILDREPTDEEIDKIERYVSRAVERGSNVKEALKSFVSGSIGIKVYDARSTTIEVY